MNPKNPMFYLLPSIAFLTTSIVAQASTPMWTFTPLNNPSMTLEANVSANVQYRITNMSSKTHTLKMKTIPGITQLTTAGTCPVSFTLASKASCILSLQINAQESNSDILGGPQVCQQGLNDAPNDLQCYQPSRNNVLNIKFSSSLARYMYIADSTDILNPPAAGNRVSKCYIDPNTGNLTNCEYTGGLFQEPFGVAVGERFAYVPNWGSLTVSKCEITPTTGSLSNCTSTGGPFTTPTGILLNKGYVYVPHFFNNTITKCTASPSTGELSSCATTGTGFNGPQGQLLANNGYFYISNSNANNVSKCEIDSSTGDLTNCVTTGSGFGFPLGVNINNGYAYVPSQSPEKISKCVVDPVNGLFSSCANLAGSPPLNAPTAVGFDKGYAYVANQLGNIPLYKCNVNAVTGNLSNCNPTGNGLSGPYGTMGIFNSIKG